MNITNLTSPVIDFIFPKTSVISGIKLHEENSNQYLSDDELKSIPLICNEDKADLHEKVVSDHAFSLFAFREGDDLSKLIYMLKYGGMKRLGEYLGKLLSAELQKHIQSEKHICFDYLISVPLFKTKVRERGYNQSDCLCKGMNEILKIKFIPDLITRIRHTSTQTMLSKEERMKNVEDAFELKKKYITHIRGKRIILVDDVITTGSTLNEAVKILKMHECAEVLVCTLAMAR
ncbi:MAG: phosphoribosyltransferase family protein [bacterium]|nr:phosphoribosyltransferase family protein [bacterium]